MLCRRNRRRTRHHPCEVFVEAAGEHTVIGGRIRPVARPDKAGVAAILAARKARDAIANLLALKQAPECVCDGVHVLTRLVSFESAAHRIAGAKTMFRPAAGIFTCTIWEYPHAGPAVAKRSRGWGWRGKRETEWG